MTLQHNTALEQMKSSLSTEFEIVITAQLRRSTALIVGRGEAWSLLVER